MPTTRSTDYLTNIHLAVVDHTPYATEDGWSVLEVLALDWNHPKLSVTVDDSPVLDGVGPGSRTEPTCVRRGTTLRVGVTDGTTETRYAVVAADQLTTIVVAPAAYNSLDWGLFVVGDRDLRGLPPEP